MTRIVGKTVGTLVGAALALLMACADDTGVRNPMGGQPCTASDQCPTGQFCRFGLCEDGTPPGDMGPGDSDPGDSDPGDMGPGDMDMGDPALPPPICACDGVQQCDASTGTCLEPAICLTDEDCDAGVCFRGNCEDAADDDCQVNADCSRGQVCITGNCVNCANDTQCREGDANSDLICPMINGLCEEADPMVDECEGSEDCLPGAFCDTDETPNLCQLVVASCQADATEPNDSLGTSATLTLDAPTAANLCGADDDWFEVPLQPGDGLVARVTYSVGTAVAPEQIEFIITDATEAQLETAQFDTANFKVLYLARAPSTPLHLLARSNNTDSEVPIEVTAMVIPGGFCLDDAFEFNNDDVNATTITADPMNEVLETDICFADEDWFVVDVAADKTITFSMEAPEGVAIPTAELFEDTPDNIVVRDNSPIDPKVITRSNSASKRYYLRLYSENPASLAGAVLTVNSVDN